MIPKKIYTCSNNILFISIKYIESLSVIITNIYISHFTPHKDRYICLKYIKLLLQVEMCLTYLKNRSSKLEYYGRFFINIPQRN